MKKYIGYTILTIICLAFMAPTIHCAFTQTELFLKVMGCGVILYLIVYGCVLLIESK